MTEENNVVEKLTPEQKDVVKKEIEELAKGGLSKEQDQEQSANTIPNKTTDQSQSH